MPTDLRLSRLLGAALPRLDILGTVLRMDAAWRERRRMQELSPEILEDIGLTRADIEKALRR